MDDNQGTASRPLTRRRFLAAVAGTAALPLLLEVQPTLARRPDRRAPHINPVVLEREAHAATQQSAIAAAQTTRPLSIAYVKGSATWPKLEQVPWHKSGLLGGAQAVPAGALSSGDASLVGRRLTVIVHGLYPSRGVLNDRSLRSLALDADFDAANPESVLKYFAWTARNGRPRNVSGRAHFKVGLIPKRRFGFELGITRDTAEVAVVRFVTGTAAGLPKLRTGCYLLGLDPHVWDKARQLPAIGSPAWRDLPSIVVTIHD